MQALIHALLQLKEQEQERQRQQAQQQARQNVAPGAPGSNATSDEAGGPDALARR